MPHQTRPFIGVNADFVPAGKQTSAHVRLGAMRQLTSRGVTCDLFMMPILPGVTDSRDNIHAVCSAAREAGASNRS